MSELSQYQSVRLFDNLISMLQAEKNIKLGDYSYQAGNTSLKKIV